VASYGVMVRGDGTPTEQALRAHLDARFDRPGAW
jgi:hypothetical protein